MTEIGKEEWGMMAVAGGHAVLKRCPPLGHQYPPET
jgi:hypothetical protein